MTLAPAPPAPPTKRYRAPAPARPSRTAEPAGGGAGVAAPGADSIPARAEGIELLGPVAGSGYREAPHLVRRGDGQTVQLTGLLYVLLEAIDGRRDHTQLAAQLSERAGKRATEQDVRFLVESKLRPAGVLREHDGSQPNVRKRNPLLALRFRYVVTDPRITRRITDPFTWLFRAPVVAAALAAFAAVSGWVLFDKGLASAAREAFHQPATLLAVFGLGLVSAGFHELGHAAACRYGGAMPGVMGVALYLVWPAFYTDVTDSYRLDRRGRLRVDLGGLYFNAVFAVAAFALWAATRSDAFLLLVPLQLVHMVRQLLPFVRLDGYHVLADLTGVPDLFARIGPTLRSMVPGRSHADARALRPWARVVVTVWVLAVVPILAALLVAAVVVLPRVMATAWDSLTLRWDEVRAQVSEGARAEPAVGVLSMGALAVPLLSTCYLICRVVSRGSSTVWRRTEGRPVLRGLAAVTAAALLALVAWSWWPRDQYRPIEAGERGTLTEALPWAPAPFDAGAEAGVQGSLDFAGSPRRMVPSTVTLFGEEMQVREAFPGLTVFGQTLVDPVYVVGDPAALADPALRPRGTTETVVVPMPSARAPGSGVPLVPLPVDGRDDNLAIARNTEDGSTVYETAFTLVWVVDDVVDQTNVADARASCTNCVTVAIAFQVVLVRGDADTVIPENQAIALNVDCNTCATYAIATQLVFTVPDTLSPPATAELTRLWSQLVALEQRIGDIPLDQLYAEISALEAQFVALLTSDAVQGGAPTVPRPGGTTTAGDAATSDTAGGLTTPDGTQSSGTEPGPTASATPSTTVADETAETDPVPSSTTTSSSTSSTPTTTTTTPTSASAPATEADSSPTVSEPG